MRNRCKKVKVLFIAIIITIPIICIKYDNVLNKIYGFLSITYPVDADVLVIEGWLLQDMFNEAAEEFNGGDYLYCLIAGKLDSFGSIRKSVKKAGFRMEDIKFAKVVEKRKHKTYNMAMAAKKWLEQNDSSVKSFNVFTGGSHGRKSWTIFRRVFESEYNIGIISSKAWYHDPAQWNPGRIYRSIVRYIAGYIYGLFWPFKT